MHNLVIAGARIVTVATRKTYFDLLNILKFDESDPILGSNHGELSRIFALFTGDNVEFNLHADHGLHE